MSIQTSTLPDLSALPPASPCEHTARISHGSLSFTSLTRLNTAACLEHFAAEAVLQQLQQAMAAVSRRFSGIWAVSHGKKRSLTGRVLSRVLLVVLELGDASVTIANLQHRSQAHMQSWLSLSSLLASKTANLSSTVSYCFEKCQKAARCF